MTSEDLKALEKAVKVAKRVASERAGELHDLVEDKLPAGYEQIPLVAQTTYEACKTWAEANQHYQAALATQN